MIKMTWYRLIFKQNQPIHIGGLKWGVLNETLLFIPGSTMWGALTNAYLLKNKPSSKEELEKIKEYFKVITCFYPCFDKEGNKVLFPKFNGGRFYLGDFLEEEFRFYFTDSLVRTALEPMGRGAKENALYELEFILSKPKKGFHEDIRSLYWVGVIKIDEAVKEIIEKESFLKEGLKVFIGGDVRYGFGELELVKKDNDIGNEELEKWNLNENGTLEIKELTLRNFLEFDNKIKFEGKLLLVPELDFKENIAKVQDAKFFISPGSKISEDLKNKDKYKLIKGRFILNGE